MLNQSTNKPQEPTVTLELTISLADATELWLDQWPDQNGKRPSLAEALANVIHGKAQDYRRTFGTARASVQDAAAQMVREHAAAEKDAITSNPLKIGIVLPKWTGRKKSIDD